MSSGAAGYLTKEQALETIAEAVRGVANGEDGWLSRRAAAQVAAWARKGHSHANGLTEREIDVVRLAARGWTNDHIAEALTISERTVRFHLTNVYAKLEVSTRGAAIAWAVREGLGDRGSE